MVAFQALFAFNKEGNQHHLKAILFFYCFGKLKFGFRIVFL
jgi:hypothetical protein